VRNLFSIVSLSIIFFQLSGCSTPTKAIPKIDQFLIGRCKELMTSTGILDYQYTVQSPLGRGVFAIAYDGSNQACGTATVRDNTREWGKLEVIALSRCESQKSQSKISTPCKIFARDFEIVWEERKKYGLE